MKVCPCCEYYVPNFDQREFNINRRNFLFKIRRIGVDRATLDIKDLLPARVRMLFQNMSLKGLLTTTQKELFKKSGIANQSLIDTEKVLYAHGLTLGMDSEFVEKVILYYPINSRFRRPTKVRKRSKGN